MDKIRLSSQYLATSLLFLFLVAVIPAFKGAGIDVRCWEKWTLFINANGLSEAYGSGTDYPPVYQYIMWLFGKFMGSPELISRDIGYLRVFTLAADFWALWLVYKWTGKRVDYIVVLACCLLNIAYSYDTMIWQQTDAIYVAFAFAALYYVYHGRRMLSAVMIILALNMKPQAIVFVPLWGIMMLGSLRAAGRWLEVIKVAAAMLLTQGLLILPFAFGKGGLAAVWRPVSNAAGVFKWITMSAYNVWYLVTDHAGDSDEVHHVAGGITYFHVGLACFSLALFVALLPAIKNLIGRFRKPDMPQLSRETIWLSAALSALVFFFFNTRMHERYSYPAFIFLAAYAFRTGRYGAYLLFSLTFFLSMEKVMAWMGFNNYDTLIFHPKFIASLYAVTIAWVAVMLFRNQRPAKTGDAVKVVVPASTT